MCDRDVLKRDPREAHVSWTGVERSPPAEERTPARAAPAGAGVTTTTPSSIHRCPEEAEGVKRHQTYVACHTFPRWCMHLPPSPSFGSDPLRTLGLWRWHQQHLDFTSGILEPTTFPFTTPTGLPAARWHNNPSGCLHTPPLRLRTLHLGLALHYSANAANRHPRIPLLLPAQGPHQLGHRGNQSHCPRVNPCSLRVLYPTAIATPHSHCHNYSFTTTLPLPAFPPPHS